MTTDNIKTSFVTENPGIVATMIHLQHQTPGVCVLDLIISATAGPSLATDMSDNKVQVFVFGSYISIEERKELPS